MSVKPWIGQLAEPENHNPVNKEKTDCTYNLEYVYGYRSADSRQNVHFNNAGNAVYMTAALGVVLDHGSNTQKFFGGGEVDNTSKQVASDQDHHTNDIMCCKVNKDRSKCVTGQVGSAPTVFVWDACSGNKIARCKLPKGCRGVNAVDFSDCSGMIACVDLHNEHQVHVFDANSGEAKGMQKGDANKIHDIAWDKRSGSSRFATAGSKHMCFWDAKGGADLGKNKQCNRKNSRCLKL